MQAVELIQTIAGILEHEVLPKLGSSNAELEIWNSINAWLTPWNALNSQGENHDKMPVLSRAVNYAVQLRIEEAGLRNQLERAPKDCKDSAAIVDQLLIEEAGRLLAQLSIRLTPEEYVYFKNFETLRSAYRAASDELAACRARIAELEAGR